MRNAAKKKKVGGKQNTYFQEERAQIGKYAAENGASKAARPFSKKTGIEMNESTPRKFKSKYLRVWVEYGFVGDCACVLNSHNFFS